jgi:hypothetical protein
MADSFFAGSGFGNLNPLFGNLNKVMNAFDTKDRVYDKNIREHVANMLPLKNKPFPPVSHL